MDLNATAAASLAAHAAIDPAPYAIGAARPRAAYRPSSPDEAAEIVRACSAEGLALVPWGGGVALPHEMAPARYDVALDVSSLDRITTYEPDDFTITAQCGVPIERLRTTLEARGQELPLEAAQGERATLGGVLAANASGPRRLALGSPRDRILGARFATGDGVLARTGGRVVKNVAGHAAHRLLVGSRGGLGVLLEASLKLPPLPPARLALVYALDAAALADAARWAGLPRREPVVTSIVSAAVASGVSALSTGAPFTAVVGFEGDAAWIEQCRSFALGALGIPAREAREADSAGIWRALADAEESAGARLSFTASHNTPDALGTFASAPGAARLVLHAPCGRLHVWPQPDEAAARAGELAGRGFTLIDARGVALECETAPIALTALRARLRAALDPRGTMAFGGRWAAGR